MAKGRSVGRKINPMPSKKAKVTKKLPVTLLSGFLGAGKTTLLKHILQGNHGRRIAVIVNDMASLNIDAALIKQNGLVQVKPEVVELQNGCICCTLRQDLIREIQRLSELQCFDYLVIESTGIAEPMQVAESFVFTVEEKGAENAVLLSDLSTLDTCVTVIDSYDFASNASSIQSIKEKFNEGGDNDNDEEGKKDIGHLLIDQIEFADVIILNKVDLTDKKELQKCEDVIRLLNPSARILKSSFGKVDLSSILDTGLFQLEEMHHTPGWLTSLKGSTATITSSTTAAAAVVDAVHSESEEYGIGHFVYRARRPFHPARLCHWLQTYFVLAEEVALSASDSSSTTLKENNELRKQQLWDEFGCVLRSKGFCWIAGAERDAVMVEWEQAGRVVSLTPIGSWFSDRSDDDLKEQFSPEEIAILHQSFEAGTDRRQELVFIGSNINQTKITASLDGLLLTEQEELQQPADSLSAYQSLRKQYLLEPVPVVSLQDPLPLWRSDVIAGPWSSTLSSQTMKLLLIPEGMQLTLCNAALEGDGIHQVWIRHSQNPRASLVCTLRSAGCEQTRLNLVFAAVDGDLELDISVINAAKKMGKESQHSSPSMVHLVGYTEWLSSEHEAEEEDHDRASR